MWTPRGSGARRSPAPSVRGARRRCADSPSYLDHGAAVQRHFQCLRKSAHDLVDLLLRHDERRRDHDEVAVRPVGVPDVGPHDEPRLLRGLGERLGETRGPRQRGARRLVLDELDSREQPAPPHVTPPGEKAPGRGSKPPPPPRNYWGGGGDPPVEEPPPGSAMNAATRLAPTRAIACSSTAPLHTGQPASSPRHAHR